MVSEFHISANMSHLCPQELFSVKGFVAVVTGGSSGIGLMISRVSCYLPRLKTLIFFLNQNSKTNIFCHQGLVANGAKVYVVALGFFEEEVQALNELGEESGGTAYG